jgi:NAD+ kinase
MKVGLVIHVGRPEPAAFARKFCEAVEEAGHQVVGNEITASLLGRPVDPGDPEIVVATGGDGTVLAAVRQALALDVPVLAFNLGTIGFLADAEPSDIDRVVEAVTAGQLIERQRMTIVAQLENGTSMVGINDVVVEKIESQRLVSLAVAVDGEDFLTYRADGLVSATSTGSTAYTFSAGGPLVDPAVEALLLTPVAAHSLFDRTLVLSPKSVITIRVATDRPVRVSVDGLEAGTLKHGEAVEVSRGDRAVRFASLEQHPFPATVKRKFRLT